MATPSTRIFPSVIINGVCISLGIGIFFGGISGIFTGNSLGNILDVDSVHPNPLIGHEDGGAGHGQGLETIFTSLN